VYNVPRVSTDAASDELFIVEPSEGILDERGDMLSVAGSSFDRAGIAGLVTTASSSSIPGLPPSKSTPRMETGSNQRYPYVPTPGNRLPPGVIPPPGSTLPVQNITPAAQLQIQFNNIVQQPTMQSSLSLATTAVTPRGEVSGSVGSTMSLSGPSVSASTMTTAGVLAQHGIHAGHDSQQVGSWAGSHQTMSAQPRGSGFYVSASTRPSNVNQTMNTSHYSDPMNAQPMDAYGNPAGMTSSMNASYGSDSGLRISSDRRLYGAGSSQHPESKNNDSMTINPGMPSVVTQSHSMHTAQSTMANTTVGAPAASLQINGNSTGANNEQSMVTTTLSTRVQKAVFAVSHITPPVTPEERAAWQEFHTPEGHYLELRSRLGYVPDLLVTENEIRQFGARARCVVYDKYGIRPLSMPLARATYADNPKAVNLANTPGNPDRVYMPANRVPIGATISTLESVRALSLVPCLRSVAAKSSLAAAHYVTERTEMEGWDAGRAEFERHWRAMASWDQRVQNELREKAKNVPKDKLPVVRARDAPLTFAAGVRGGPYDDTPKVRSNENNVVSKLTIRLLDTLTQINNKYYQRRREAQEKGEDTRQSVRDEAIAGPHEAKDPNSMTEVRDSMDTMTATTGSGNVNQTQSHASMVLANAESKHATAGPNHADTGAGVLATEPAVPGDEDGDDEDYDLGDFFNTLVNDRYTVEKKVGHGSFGRVYIGTDTKENRPVAIKVIKKKQAFIDQANVEIRLLRELGKSAQHRPFIVMMLDTFMYRDHRCIVFEKLSVNLYELLRMNRFRGLAMDILTPMTYNLLVGLDYIGAIRYRYPDGRISSRPGIIHCDLKPENILLHSTRTPALVKIIDFGSACFVPERVYTYIQSRFYRAPEILLGTSYGCAIDMWSLGCIIFELFTGRPLFPGEDEAEQVGRHVAVLGLPPFEMVCNSRKGSRYFSIDRDEKTVKYIKQHTIKQTSLEQELGSRFTRSRPDHVAMLDLISQMLVYDPAQRITPAQALQHSLFSRILIATVNKDGSYDRNSTRPTRPRTDGPGSGSGSGSGSSSGSSAPGGPAPGTSQGGTGSGMNEHTTTGHSAGEGQGSQSGNSYMN